MEKKPGFYSIKDILPGVIGQLSQQKAEEQVSLDKLWKDTVGPEAEKAILVGSKDGNVFVTVDCAARLFQMRMRKQTILSKLQKQNSEIQNIIFKIGKVT